MTTEFVMSDFKKDKSETLTAASFKAHCLRLMDEVQQKKKSITITKRGAPIAKLVPVEGNDISIFGWMKGTIIETNKAGSDEK
jgi:prevent-host-death family protein